VFGPSAWSPNLLYPLLTSATSSRRLSTALAHWQDDRSPRVLRTHFHAYARRIYVKTFRAGIGLWRALPSYPALPPLMRFLFVGPAFCLQLPPDSTSRWTPLPFG